MSLSRTPTNKSTREGFIEKALLKHGDKFDYSNVVYNTCKQKVTIICKIENHGAFDITPDSHLSGKGGCQKCKYNTISTKKRKTQEDFISQARQMHGDLYDYSYVKYINHTTPVQIICDMHGVFEQRAGNHLRGDGCGKCAGTYKLTTAEWIEKAKRKHGDLKFDYSRVMYINAYTDVTIGCNKCLKYFQQTPSSHINSEIGCDWCRKKHAYTTEEFIEEARKIHGDIFDYSKTEYISATKPITIICRTHGEFRQTPSDHKNQRSGCQKCSNVYSPTTAEWVIQAKGRWSDVYDYSKVVYKTASEKIIIICKTHGEFECTPNNHLHATNPTGCPSCARKGEGMVAAYLQSEGHHHIKEWGAEFLNGKRMDYFLSDINAVIEVDGEQHFTQVWNWHPPTEQRYNDITKMKKCISMGISVIRITHSSIMKETKEWQLFLSSAITRIVMEAQPIVIFENVFEYQKYKDDCDTYGIIYN